MQNNRNRKLAARLNMEANYMKLLNFSAIVILTIVFMFIDQSFVSGMNLKNLLSDTAPLMIMAIGATFVLLIGSIDLSVGSVCSVANIIAVRLLLDFTARTGNTVQSTFLAYGLTLLFGACAGALLGFVQVKWKIPSFIASLGFMSIWKSIALLITEVPISIPRAAWAAINWFKVSFGLVGIPLIFVFALAVILYLTQRKTVFGKSVMAVGGNERTARISGIKVDRTKVIAFTINGVCAAIGGILLAAKLKSASPTIGDAFTLLVICSAVLGGTALSGGKGSVLGTILGVFTVTAIRNGMNIVGVNVFWQNIVFGIVVLLSVFLTIDRSHTGVVPK